MKLFDTLTPQQRVAIVARIKHGGCLKLAARELGISHHTVHDRSSRAFRRLGCTNMVHATQIAMREGVVA